MNHCTFKALTPAGEWVEGWFEHSFKDAPVIWTRDKLKGVLHIVLPETVCMATGLTDRNGKKIKRLMNKKLRKGKDGKAVNFYWA